MKTRACLVWVLFMLGKGLGFYLGSGTKQPGLYFTHLCSGKVGFDILGIL